MVLSATSVASSNFQADSMVRSSNVRSPLVGGRPFKSSKVLTRKTSLHPSMSIGLHPSYRFGIKRIRSYKHLEE